MDDDLLNLEKKYCSYGDTVHYAEYPKVFSRCEGSYMLNKKDLGFHSAEASLGSMCSLITE